MSSFFRYFWIFSGSICLGLGIIGILVPLLPTTSFLLLTAYCYFKGSPRLYRWLINQPRLGKYIIDYREYKVIPPRAKIMSLTLLWASIIYCIYFMADQFPLRFFLSFTALGVTIHILSFNDRRQNK
ncbi:MAG: YbaN family protein [Candidatus Azobacteroides sp.]|nr:YbaN family protein [Candidatus Azobacteroides sp.]